MGRPRKSRNDRFSVAVSLRLKPDEARILKRGAKRLEMNVNEYLRSILAVLIGVGDVKTPAEKIRKSA